jgi:hypothetical protein
VEKELNRMGSNSLAAGTAYTAASSQAIASFADRDSGPDTDPHSSFWTDASSVIAVNDNLGNSVPNHETEILLRWTYENLYLLFICPYQELNLKPHPDLTAETYELWNWDVAEVFIGADFQNIRRYKEFEVSPQGEWVDLDVNLDNPPHEVGWVWESGCEVAARIDAAQKTWYGFMRIPWPSIDNRPVAAGNELRINFYRGQGRAPNLKLIAWQPTHKPTFHAPESFGVLKLAAQ